MHGDPVRSFPGWIEGNLEGALAVRSDKSIGISADGELVTVDSDHIDAADAEVLLSGVAYGEGAGEGVVVEVEGFEIRVVVHDGRGKSVRNHDSVAGDHDVGRGKNQFSRDVEPEITVHERGAYKADGGSAQSACGGWQETDCHGGIPVPGNDQVGRIDHREIAGVLSGALEEEDLQRCAAEVADGELVVNGSGAGQNLAKVGMIATAGGGVSIADDPVVAPDLDKLGVHGPAE